MPDAGDPPPPPPLPTAARRALPWLTAGRFGSNLGVRFPITFIEPLARGVGVSLDTMGLVLGLRELTGLVGPWAGRRADRGRRNRLVLAGLAGCGLTMALGALSPGVAVLAVVLVVFGAGKATHDVASNGWIGEHVPFARRGLVTGLVETSWAGALLVGVPVLGLLLDGVGWRAPFVATAVLCALPLLALPRLLGPDAPTRPGAGAAGPDDPAAGPEGPTSATEPISLDGQVWEVDAAADRHRPGPATVATIAALALAALAMQLVTVAFGPWLEDGFGFSIAAVGSASIAFGLGEAGGTLGSARFADRLGKRRTVLVGLALMVPCTAALAAVEGRPVAALALFAVVSGAFELAFVSTMPLLTELEPRARAATVGQAFATFTAARAVATAAGAAAYGRWGMGVVIAGACALTAAAIVVLAVRGVEPGGRPGPVADPA